MKKYIIANYKNIYILFKKGSWIIQIGCDDQIAITSKNRSDHKFLKHKYNSVIFIFILNLF